MTKHSASIKKLALYKTKSCKFLEKYIDTISVLLSFKINAENGEFYEKIHLFFLIQFEAKGLYPKSKWYFALASYILNNVPLCKISRLISYAFASTWLCSCPSFYVECSLFYIHLLTLDPFSKVYLKGSRGNEKNISFETDNLIQKEIQIKRVQ